MRYLAQPEPVLSRCARALAMARDLIARTQVHSVRDWFACTFEVTDENGQPVMTVPFGDTVTEEPDEA